MTPVEMMIQVAGDFVCVDCKPVLLQKLAEGVAPRKVAVAPVYFPVSLTKLTLLSLTTFGLYHLYWFYKNWSFEQNRTGENISPVLRTIFSVIFAYSLFHRMYAFSGNFTGNLLGLAAAENNAKVVRFKYPPSGLAAGFVIITLLSRLPGSLWLLSQFNFIPLLLVQRSVQQINATFAPGSDPNAKFSLANIITISIGGLLLLLTVAGEFLLEPLD